MEMNEYYLKDDIYLDLNEDKAIKTLSSLIKCKSISYIDQKEMDFNEFKKIHKYIDDNFPFIKKYSKSKVINEGSIYYYLEGKDKSLGSLLLMGHIDVVPSIQDDKWEYDAFSGMIKEGFIYGRGSLDMKHIDSAILNAVEYYLSHFGQLNRSVYICFGHDEETLGYQGQYQIKEDLKKQKANISMVIDEGGGFIDGKKFSSNKTICHIQVMEKGYLDLELVATSKGGHSSRPGNHTALGRVAHAIAEIEDNPFESNLNEPLIMFYKNIKDDVYDSELKSLIDNIDNNPKALIKYLEKDEDKLPLLKTSIAATMIESDSKGANILPQKVKAMINFRLSNFDTVDSVYNKIKTICDKYDVQVVKKNCIEASKVSSIDSNEYSLLENMIKEYFKDVNVVPYITVGGTDCCFYNELCDNCYRFSPIIYRDELSSGVHGINEHIEISSYLYGIKFYIELLERYCK